MTCNYTEGTFHCTFTEREALNDARLRALRIGAKRLPGNQYCAVFSYEEARNTLSLATLAGVPYSGNNSRLFDDNELYLLQEGM